MAGWSLNVQRGFTCGLLHSSTASLHTVASPLKGATSVYVSTFHDEELDMCQSAEVGSTKELLHSAASILQSSIQEVSCNVRGWKVLKQGEHGIMDKLIPDYAWKVLRRLQERGHETYLVGGSVRDMLLKQAPKDFDVITTAELNQVKRGFYHALIVGKRFPVCQVHICDKIVEVSSFSTVAKIPGKRKLAISLADPDFHEIKKSSASYQRHYARWENSMRRDFTINGLLYDPFEKTLYDYLGGVEDLTKKKVRTVAPANESFVEDSARILRALRIAARLGFKFSRETAQAIQLHSGSIKFLHQDRLRLETNYLMSYGAAEPSLRLLWRFGLLEILFPPQAAYLAAQGFKRQEQSSNMLLALLANLDKLLSPAKPCHCCLWINLLALHLALSDHPQSPVVVSALALAIHGNELGPAVQKAIKIHGKYGDLVQSFPELETECPKMTRGRVKRKVLQLCDDVVNALHLMSSPDYVSNAMWRHQEAPSSNLVIVTKQLLGRCEELFFQVYEDSEQNDSVLENEEKCVRGTRKGRRKSIDRAALQQGSLDEVSFVFSHIVMSTLYPHAGKRQKE